MKNKAVVITAVIVLIISIFTAACTTAADGEPEAQVPSDSAEKHTEKDSAESEIKSAAYAPESEIPVEIPDVKTPDIFEVEDGGEEPLSNNPAEDPDTPEPEPSAASEEPPVEASAATSETEDEDSPWLEDQKLSRDYILANLVLPKQIRLVYNTSLPIVVTGSGVTSDWRLSFYYWPEGSRSALGIKLNREDQDFIGRVTTELLPGMNFFYNLRIEIPGPNGGVFDFPGGPRKVLNDGPQAYSKTEIEKMFFYQPLFDVEHRGDSPGVRRGSHGWEFRELFLSAEIHRWTCRIFYRKKDSGDSWQISDFGGEVWRNDGAEKIKHSYNLPMTSMKTGDVIEYYFELGIIDTNQFFELRKNNPPLFKIKSLE